MVRPGVGLDEMGEQGEGLGSARDRLEGDRDVHLAGQIGALEPVRVPDPNMPAPARP
jgi:hypothetical protein